MTPADSSRRAGTSGKHINQIIQGIAAITPDTALALEQVPGVPAGRKTRRQTPSPDSTRPRHVDLGLARFRGRSGTPRRPRARVFSSVRRASWPAR